MSKRLILGVIGLLMAGLVLVGCGENASANSASAAKYNRSPDPVPGTTFVTQIAPGDVEAVSGLSALDYSLDYQGRWELKFGEQGRFSAKVNGQLVVEGLYSYSVDQLVFYGGKWSAACADTGDMGRRPYHAPGVYSFDYDGTTLVLNALSEPCQARKLIVSSHPLVLSTAR